MLACQEDTIANQESRLACQGEEIARLKAQLAEEKCGRLTGGRTAD